jgi:hypothetical protein
MSHDSSESEPNEPEDSKLPTKVFIPPDFNKARRNVTKLVETYFKRLKEEIKYGAKLHINRNKLTDIEEAIIDYVGLRYNGKGIGLELKIDEEGKGK